MNTRVAQTTILNAFRRALHYGRATITEHHDGSTTVKVIALVDGRPLLDATLHGTSLLEKQGALFDDAPAPVVEAPRPAMRLPTAEEDHAAASVLVADQKGPCILYREKPGSAWEIIWRSTDKALTRNDAWKLACQGAAAREYGARRKLLRTHPAKKK